MTGSGSLARYDVSVFEHLFSKYFCRRDKTSSGASPFLLLPLSGIRYGTVCMLRFWVCGSGSAQIHFVVLWICDLLFFECSFMSLGVFFECSFSILEDKKLIKSNITVKIMVFRSVGDPGSGTFLTTGFGIRNSFFRDG